MSDKRCNELCALFEKNVENKETKVKKNGVIVYSDLLLEYLKKNYPGLYFVSSTTKVLTDFEQFLNEVNRTDFQYVVPDFMNVAGLAVRTGNAVTKQSAARIWERTVWSITVLRRI